jgi:hypothetical protein
VKDRIRFGPSQINVELFGLKLTGYRDNLDTELSSFPEAEIFFSVSVFSSLFQMDRLYAVHFYPLVIVHVQSTC